MSDPIIGWEIDPATKDYVVLSGSPVNDTTILTSAYIRLTTPRTQWMYAPNSQYGSDYYTAHRRLNNTQVLEQYGNKALAPLVTIGRAQSAVVTTVAAQRGFVSLAATIVNASGQPEVLNFTPAGGL